MRKWLIPLLLSVTLLIGLVACGAVASTTNGPSISSNVYVAGCYKVNSGDSFWLACYWLNGTRTTLGTGSYTSVGRAIAASNTGVYVAGSQNTPSGTVQACYWFNSTQTILTPTSNNAQAYGVAIASGDVYFAGFYNDAGSGYDIACYWKNGVCTTVGPAGKDSYARGIVVSGNDVYLVGHYDSTGSSTHYRTCYWKNGAKTDVDPSTDSEGYAIALDGAIVYTTGRRGSGMNPCYWANTSPTDIDGSNSGITYAIDVSGGSIYVGGSKDLASVSYAFTKLNTNATSILVSTTVGSRVTGVKQYLGDVYAVGSRDDNTRIGCVWKNGVVDYDLPGNQVFANAIYIP